MTTAPEIHRFTRRVRAAVFAGAIADALAATAMVGAAGLLTARFLGAWPTPTLWWVTALALPTLWAVWRTRSLAFGHARSAVHLDRRLGLDGLLVTSMELDTSAWNAILRAKLQHAAGALPHLRAGRLAMRALVPLALLGAVLLLPPLEDTPLPVNPAVELAIAEIEQEIDELTEEAVLSEEKAEELRARLQDIEENAAMGDAVEWADLDGLRDELVHERSQLTSALEKARSALAEIQTQASTATAASTAEQLTETLRQAAEAGLLEGLDPELLGSLDLPPGTDLGALDPSQLPMSLAELEALAGALSEAMDERVGELGKAGILDPDELADLAELVEAAGILPPEPDHEHGAG